MEQRNEARAWLERDTVLHANMLEVLRRGSAEALTVEEGGVLLYDTGCGAWMLAAEPAAAGSLLDRLPAGCDLFVGHDMAWFDLARERLGLPEVEVCYSSAYLAGEPLPIPDFGGELRLLDRSWTAWLCAHYSHDFGGAAYMERAVDRGMVGAFVEGEPAGFVGFHDEGSIGMLEVLPAYRRRGLGEILQQAAINLALERGQIPFGQVIDGNTASLGLQRKLGMAVSQSRLFWLIG
ncbi:GNAT family N-acetyltransferase [Intestinimonas sp.]|uniref:GNAT family N-acetyltransferase n=1 Tax=Intestinimonas sp. TaxID=1965293 RepID=UPI002639F49D|nr:GNAT family N-acetyltransferase [Intestinimonas sp.]